MAHKKRIPKLASILAVSALGLTASASWAARQFTPQAGTWMVSSEIDGKPGRGLAIDVQGNTFFMQVFGYEKNGDATFYTATGQMEGNSVIAPLMRYKNGRSLAGSMQDAVEDQSMGQVTVSFSNGLKGTLQLPGESAVPIERFMVSSDEPSVTNPRAQLGNRRLRLFALDAQGDPSWTIPGRLWRNDDGQTQLEWTVTSSTGLEVPLIRFQCDALPGLTRLHCTPVTPKTFPNLESQLPPVESLDLQFAGFDIQGALHTAGDNPQTVTIMGFDEGASLLEPTYLEGSTRVRPQQRQDYLSGGISTSESCQVTCVRNSTSNTLMPMNGTWVVQDELTGKPGRGIALDVQGNTVILQLFNYRADGQPTFHMGSATYQSNGANSRASVATIPLRQYRGGRSLGGAAQSGQWEADAGDALLEFSSPAPEPGTRDLQVWWTQGQLQLPGEAPVKIRRLQTDTPISFSERMFGDWYMRSRRDIVRLEREQGDAVTTSDGKFLCRPGLPGSSSLMCGEPNGENQWHTLDFPYLPGMARFGPYLRLRDRFGNSVGLGKLE